MTATPAQLLTRQWGKRLAAERKGAGLSQQQLATRVQRDQPWVSRYERGKGTWTIDVMILFAAALGKPVDHLFPFTPGIEAMEQFRLGLAA
mgnify:CR=1 FL=1